MPVEPSFIVFYFYFFLAQTIHEKDLFYKECLKYKEDYNTCEQEPNSSKNKKKITKKFNETL